MVRAVCVSDTHEKHGIMTSPIPEGDLLIHAGDIMSSGYDPDAIENFCTWFSSQPHPNKVVTPGNHDRFCQTYPDEVLEIFNQYSDIHYLVDDCCTISGLKIYGSPWQPWFYDWAFNLQRGKEIAEKWKLIPDDVDILITHGPPYGIRDKVRRDGLNVGCEDLLDRLQQLSNLKLHVFGHIHEAYGALTKNGITYVNASICTLQYYPLNKPVVVEVNRNSATVIEGGIYID
jgi:Icc-related predicted phosphoesterase